MCGRYTLFDAVDLAIRYDMKPKPPGLVGVEDNYNVSPGQFMPVVYIEDGEKCDLHLESHPLF